MPRNRFLVPVTAPAREEAGDFRRSLGSTHMSRHKWDCWGQFAVAASVMVVAAMWSWTARGGNNNGFFGSAVGGVVVDTNGVLRAATVDETNKLSKARAEQAKQMPQDMGVATQWRKVSLRRLQEEFLARKEKAQSPLFTEEMEYLAGLTRIQYVFGYPEEKDIVLVGPAEPIKASANGHMVGTETGHPILQLDHLLVAMRTAEAAGREPISCSIDPTKEGIAAFNQIVGQTRRFDNTLGPRLEKAMGMQDVTITGVPGGSDFARTMVAADYRMKRLAMGFDKIPVRGLPTYLSMVTANSPAMPRWWMAPNYEAILKDPEGLAWELRGLGVKVMTEDTIFGADGNAKRTGKANPAAQKWADQMTSKYDELMVHYPIFGELRHMMIMAVVGALIVKNDLLKTASLDVTPLMTDRAITSRDDFPVPKKVPTIVSWDKQGGRYVVTASGGVEINSWKVADKTETSKTLGQGRQSATHSGSKWWWN